MDRRIPSTLGEIAEAVQQILAEHGPMTRGQLQSALPGLGVDLGREPATTVADLVDGDDLALVLPLLDERYALLSALLDGRVFTHRLDAVEAEHDLITVSPDLLPVAMLSQNDTYQRLTDGAPVADVLPGFDADTLTARGVPVDVIDQDGALLLPAGRFQQLGAGADTLVGIRVTSDGWDVMRVDHQPVAATSGSEGGARLNAVLEKLAGGEPAQLDALIWTACADDPNLFATPDAPLVDLLDAAGLGRDGDHVAAAGFDFASRRVQARIEATQRLHDLDEDGAVAVLVLIRLYDHVGEVFDAATAARDAEQAAERVAAAVEAGTRQALAEQDHGDAGSGLPDRQIVGSVLESLADPGVAEAVLAQTLGSGVEDAAVLGLFAESLEQWAPRPARPALRWFRAKANERMGAVSEAEQVLRTAAAADPAWPPALYDLARYASDRGDADRGLALLRRADTPSYDELVQLLVWFRPQPRPDVGRNQPCWCGSGRKYKHCHLRDGHLPLADRAAWLYQKAGRYLQDGPWRGDILHLADIRTQYGESPDAFLAGVGDPLVADALLFEGGAFAEFLQRRGQLLPDDERLLAEQWLLVDRSVYETEAVYPGEGFTVRDLRTGDRHDVAEQTASKKLEPGTLICARILPAADTMQIFGGIEPVDLITRDHLITLLDERPTPSQLVAFLSGRYAPPQLANTEGEPVVLCEASMAVTDAPALAAALDQTYDRDDTESEPQWVDHMVTQGMYRVRATLGLFNDQVHVETNSEQRLDRVLDTLHSLQPSMTVTAESRRPADEVREAMSRQTPDASHTTNDSANTDQMLHPSNPDAVNALAEFTRQYEQHWLDDSIPALQGQTPRQAATDPTRRPDLLRLLDSFPEDNNPATMSPNRLRKALGLSISS